jgi:WD40 repeat protein
MDDDSKAHLEILRRSHERRLQELEKQVAVRGVDTPPHITIEIQDIRSTIADIDRQLASKATHGVVRRTNTTTLLVHSHSWQLWLILGGAAILVVLFVTLRTFGGAGNTFPTSVASTAQPAVENQPLPMTTRTTSSTTTGNRLRLIRTLPYSNGIASVALSPDGQIVALGFYDGTVTLWQVDDGTLLRTFTSGVTVGAVAFSSNSKILATGSANATIKLWNVADGMYLRTLEGLSSFVYSVAFSPDDQIVAAGSFDHVGMWRVSDGMLFQNLEGHTSHVYSVAFSSDRRLLASASSDDTVKVWQVSDGKQLLNLKADGFDSVAFSRDDTKLAATGNVVYLWRARDGAPLYELKGHTDTVGSVAFSTDGQTLVSVSNDIEVRRWQVSDGTRLYTIEQPEENVHIVSFGADGRTMVSVTSNVVQVWEVP